jgi:hypothetical protein
MIMLSRSYLAAWIFLIGTGGFGMAQTHAKGPEKNQIIQHQIEIFGKTGKTTIRFQAPKATNLEWAPEVQSQVDLRNPPTSKAFGYELAQLTWDYGRWFWQGVHGNIQIRLTVQRVDDLEESLKIPGVIEKTMRERALRSNIKTREGSHMNKLYFVEIPEVEVVNDLRWYRFRFRKEAGPCSDWLAVTPLDEKHQIELKINFITNRGNLYQSDWEEQARALAERIFNSIQLEPRPANP